MCFLLIRIYSLCFFGYLCYGYDESVLDNLTYNSLDEWFNQLNAQYQTLNQYSASFVWELSINPTERLYDEASEFGGIRSRWRNSRCSEAETFKENMSSIQNRMIDVLCRGPKYTDYQSNQLSALLTKIQDIYTETELCLPIAYDVCINYNRIWDYTYIRRPNNEIYLLDMSSILPKEREDYNPLHFFDGKVSTDYYVLRGVKPEDDVDHQTDSEYDKIDEEIRDSGMLCMNIEPELEKLMAGNFSNLRRQDCVLPADIIFRWAWEAWRLAVGPDIAKYYPSAVYLMNLGAQNNGYSDIGESWRQEMEMDDVRKTSGLLWETIKPYYKLLHAVFRNALYNKYENKEEVTRTGTLPAYIMGNMWSQDWSSYHELLIPNQDISLDENLEHTNWTSHDLVKRADDFYTSMGLRPMTKKFWSFSNFNKVSNKSKCHGSAANMFNTDDYRMIVCAERTFDDFYVIVHEMGHIHYYMQYAEQPPLFQDATNSAIGEAIGDAIYLAMMTPHHLNRLGLLPDKYLFTESLPRFKRNDMRMVHEVEPNKDFMKAPNDRELLNRKLGKLVSDPEMLKYLDNLIDKAKYMKTLDPITVFGEPYPKISEINERMKNYNNFKEKNDHSMNSFDLTLLLRMALSKIPQIPFEYILDIFRWDLFSGKIPFSQANKYYWELSIKEQGIHPPKWEDRRNFFDAAAKFHVADNTPYIRYFLASFLQTQIFKGLCEITIFGRFKTNKKLPMPLHRCDIYGSKRAGKLLQKALKLGSSAHWTEVLYILTGSKDISVQPLIEYYEPLFNWIQKLVIEFDIPVGW